MPFLHFPQDIYILKVNAQLSSGGRQPSAEQTSKYHYVQTQNGLFHTTNSQHCIDSMESMQLKAEFKITRQFYINATPSKMFHILKLGG